MKTGCHNFRFETSFAAEINTFRRLATTFVTYCGNNFHVRHGLVDDLTMIDIFRVSFYANTLLLPGWMTVFGRVYHLGM